MKNCDAIVIGGSAGSLDVLLKVLPFIRTGIPFAIITVLHRKAGTDSLLTGLLSSRTGLTVKEAEEKELVGQGIVYIAPANYHLLIEKNRTFSFDTSEKVNFSRPSIDVTFQSAAEVYKDKLVGILLSGSNSDGVNGLKEVKQHGGKTIIQNPESAAVSFMPGQAQINVKIDAILQIGEMAGYINGL